jgi:hypothetical protein
MFAFPLSDSDFMQVYIDSVPARPVAQLLRQPTSPHGLDWHGDEGGRCSPVVNSALLASLQSGKLQQGACRLTRSSAHYFFVSSIACMIVLCVGLDAAAVLPAT